MANEALEAARREAEDAQVGAGTVGARKRGNACFTAVLGGRRATPPSAAGPRPSQRAFSCAVRTVCCASLCPLCPCRPLKQPSLFPSSIACADGRGRKGRGAATAAGLRAACQVGPGLLPWHAAIGVSRPGAPLKCHAMLSTGFSLARCRSTFLFPQGVGGCCSQQGRAHCLPGSTHTGVEERTVAFSQRALLLRLAPEYSTPPRSTG